MFKPYNSSRIVKNFQKVITTKDINFLAPATYKFLNLYFSRIIAHYSFGSFRGYYRNVKDLSNDIKRYYDSNLRHAQNYSEDTFFLNNYGKEYCKSVTETMIGILENVN